ncbi:uncharacterized protein LOC143212334 isoform X2 [Lasioglossum baleicum]
MEPEAVKKNNVKKRTFSGLVSNTVTMRKQRSKALLKTIVIEEDKEKMDPFVALDRMLPNLKEINETYSENATTETLNKSISNSKETLNSSSGNTCKEEMEADGNAKKGHATPIEHPSAETVQENETGMSSNKNTLSDISEKSRSESTHTITQMKTSIPDVPKTQSPISTEVTPRKLRLKNESSIKEEDEHLSNKENRASNIIEDPKSNDLTVSNILSRSQQQVDSSDNSQHSIVQKLRKTPLNDSLDQSNSSTEVCEDSSSNGNNQTLNSEENINDTHIDIITLGDETITLDESDEMCLILEAEETANVGKEDLKEVCITQIATADAECEGNNQAAVFNTSGNLNDTGFMEYSKLSDMSVDKISTSSITSMGETTTNDLQETDMATDETTPIDLQETEMATDETTTNDLQETEVAAEVPSRESITKEPFDVHTQSNNVELANENENNISNVIENNVAQSLVEPINKASEEVDITQNTSKVDNCLALEEKSITDSNSQNDREKNEIAETVQKQEEKMPVDDNLSDAHIDTDLFQDIPADEWTERNSDKNSVHSMSTERLESSDYDSDDTVLLKAQKNSLQEKTVERMDMSESQCETNENKSTMVKDTQQSMRQEKIIAAEANSENQEGHVANQTEEVQNAENVSTRTSITNEVSKQSPLESDTSLEKPADTNLTTEIDQTLDTESPLNKRESKSRLSKDGSNERKSVCKSVEKSDSEVEEPSEVDAVDEKDSLSKSPIGSPSNVSDSSKTDESMDSDIEREYNLNGVEVCKFSDDDVPGDECRASETESSDPDDNGSDLADFVVNDDDEISEEVESRELHEGSSNGYDDKHLESDRDAIDEERGKIQMQDEKRRKNGKQNRIDRGTSEKEKSKSKKSEKLGLDKITGSDKKITNSENRTIDKRRKRNKVKRCVEEEEISEKELAEQSRKVQIYKEEIAKKVTTKVQRRRGAEEYVDGIEDKYTDTPKKEQSKLRKTTKLDLSEMSESGKNVKRKCEIETGNRIRKIKADDNGSRMQKENAIPTWKKYETPTVKSNKMEVSRKRGRNLLEDSPSGFTIDILKKRKLNLEGSSSLSLYGSTTNFYVQDIEKLKKRKNTSETQLYRQRMLNRRARHLNNLMFLETIRFVYTANLVGNHLKLF